MLLYDKNIQYNSVYTTNGICEVTFGTLEGIAKGGFYDGLPVLKLNLRDRRYLNKNACYITTINTATDEVVMLLYTRDGTKILYKDSYSNTLNCFPNYWMYHDVQGGIIFTGSTLERLGTNGDSLLNGLVPRDDFSRLVTENDQMAILFSSNETLIA